MKEIYFILDIHIPNPEVFCKLFQYNQSCIAIAESNKLKSRKNISPLSIIIYEFLNKIILFGYDIFIQENK